MNATITARRPGEHCHYLSHDECQVAYQAWLDTMRLNPWDLLVKNANGNLTRQPNDLRLRRAAVTHLRGLGFGRLTIAAATELTPGCVRDILRSLDPARAAKDRGRVR